ncbi:MAG: helix-turn-helix transcriptional regulator [Oscillospiraceae bacterium]|nr:helix-turn-helix transcriptional regulator [Oscillospiraceae bacterium]MBR5306350.1 helix-turn-helix transcriptional regulator [Oscillospiraceae bacterium]
MDEKFFRDRVTQLRLKKGVSEYQMSYDLGHSRGYVYNISSGKALPPMKEFFGICEYFGITPSEFFNEENQHPILINKINEEIKNLSEDDLIILLTLIKRFSDTK